MTVYVPGTLETDPKKVIMSLQQIGSGLDTANANIATNTTNIATNTANIASNTSAITALQSGPLPSGDVAAKSDQTTGTSNNLAVTPSTQQYHASAAKAWAHITISGGTYTLQSKYNVASITKNGTGDVTLTFTTPFTSTDYCAVASISGGSFIALIGTRTTSSVEVTTRNSTTGASADASEITVVCFGAQ